MLLSSLLQTSQGRLNLKWMPVVRVPVLSSYKKMTKESDHPVCFYSKKFNHHQVNYSTIEKEALALLLALQHFEVYVGSSSQPVDVYTDHNPLIFLQQMCNKNQRLMRWSLICQSFNLQIKYKKGVDNMIADSLSRCPV